MIETTVWGGAGEHGRSSYFVKKGELRVLLDCGVKKQGVGTYPLLDSEQVRQLDAVFLSHAHEDHSVALPLLYQYGYAGVVWTTRATVEQLPHYYAAWQSDVRSRCGQLPYTQEDIARIRYAYVEDEAEPGTWFALGPSLRVMWGRSGHMLGSIWLLLDLAGSLLFFSGDFSAESLLLVADQPLLPPTASEDWGAAGAAKSACPSASARRQNRIELALIDAAYGLDADSQVTKLAQLQARIAQAAANGGKVLLPVPAAGRSQDLAVWLVEQFPGLPLFVEPKIADGLRRLLQKPEWLRPKAAERIAAALAADQLTIMQDDEADRLRHVTQPGAGVILTSDGMLQSPQAQWYYRQLCANSANAVILSGHLAAGTFGRLLLLQPRHASACDVQFIRYKVHQGLPDVKTMLQQLKSERTLLVHAEKAATDALAAVLRQQGFRGLYSLGPGDTLSSAPQ